MIAFSIQTLYLRWDMIKNHSVVHSGLCCWRKPISMILSTIRCGIKVSWAASNRGSKTYLHTKISYWTTQSDTIKLAQTHTYTRTCKPSLLRTYKRAYNRTHTDEALQMICATSVFHLKHNGMYPLMQKFPTMHWKALN